MVDRPQPFDLLFAPFRDDRLPAIRDVIGTDRSVAGFLLVAPAVELLRDVRPDSGLGDAIDTFVLLVHAAFWYWHDGEQHRAIDAAQLERLLRDGAPQPIPAGITRYIQVAPRRIWSQLDDDQPFEPLDGWFVARNGPSIDVVGCFGVHPERPGITAAAVQGPVPVLAKRPDGTAPFTATMPGGDLAGLHAVESPAELLWLAWCADHFEEGS
ncbi:MAG TPA: hypothetical protein VGM77_05220 [Gemmatimonadales bacterium]|jgi:hypothetical protein